MATMTIQTIISKALAQINAMGGIVNHDYWRGYCDSFDQMNEQPKNTTWQLVLPHIQKECEQVKNPFIITK